MPKVLVACEESQTVCKSFRQLNIEAYSCDLEDCSGGYPEWHIKGDALVEAYSGKYDLMVAHPPCTYLCVAGAARMYPTKGNIDQSRLDKAREGKIFFLALLNAPIKYVAVENPQPLKVVELPVHSQVIQPYEYGDPFSKKTLLWLKNLPLLKSTNVLETWKPYLDSNPGGKKRGQKSTLGIAHTKKQRSKTFDGIANAMATQWSKVL